MAKKTIYLASPLGFAESTRAFMDRLVAELREVVDVSNPWDDVRFADEFTLIASLDSRAEATARLERINEELARANTEHIDAAEAVFAILDGVDVDSGTAAEIGYAFAKGKQVHGLRTDFRLAGDNAGAIVNLQVEYFIRASGGGISQTASDLVEVARNL